jgi:hypothetical protein
MKQLDKNEILYTLDIASRQTYKKWKQVVFTATPYDDPQLEDERYVIINSSFNSVRDIEMAVTQHCHPQGYAVLLNYNERFSSPEALAEIAKGVGPVDIVGAFLSLRHEGRTISPKEEYARFHRGRDGIVHPNYAKIEGVLNHMRVFAIESFRYIPQFDLRDIQGVYFKDRMIFLMTLLEMIRTEIREPHYLYLLKRYSSTWNAPRRAVIIQNDITIQISEWEAADREQLRRTKTRLEC